MISKYPHYLPVSSHTIVLFVWGGRNGGALAIFFPKQYLHTSAQEARHFEISLSKANITLSNKSLSAQ